jgi:S1-C subfamily serine protease
MEGRLVGVNTAILSRSGGSNGIGFAVPANLVAKVVNSARAGQTELIRPWLGFDGASVDGELALALGLTLPRGVLIEQMHPASPLMAAGLIRGDIIATFDFEPVNTTQELAFRAATQRLGEKVSVGFLRNGAKMTAQVHLAAAPEDPPRDQRSLTRGDGLPGLTVLNVNPSVIDAHDLKASSEGVLVLGVRGAARRVGLRSGDFVREVNGVKVETVSALVRELKKTHGDTVLNVERQGRRGDIRYRR